jgi:hypothetical protein
MVEFTEVKLNNYKSYKITPTEEFRGRIDRFNRTIRNINSMLGVMSSIMVVIPVRALTKLELEEYRAYFCKYAKAVKCNMVYFEGPVTVEEIERVYIN